MLEMEETGTAELIPLIRNINLLRVTAKKSDQTHLGSESLYRVGVLKVPLTIRNQ